MCAAMITMMPDKLLGKTKIYPRPVVKCKIEGQEITGLVDSGASLSVISEKVYRSLWKNWTFTQLPMPNHLRVTGITGHNMKFVDYVLMDIELQGRTIQRPLLVATGLDHTELILGWDTIVEEHMIIDGEENSVKFKERPRKNDEWHAAALCAIRAEKIYPRTISKMLLEPRAGKGLLKEGTLGICYGAQGAPLIIWDSLSGVDENGRVTMAVANFGHEPVAVKPNDCIAFMKNPESHDTEIIEGNEQFIHSMLAGDKENENDFKEPEKGCINKLSDKEKKEFMSKLHCKSPSEWQQRYVDLIMRYNDVFSKDKFDLGWTNVMEHKVHMKNENPVYVKQFRVPYEHQAVLHEFVDELLKKGAIQESRSPYNSPVFCVPKKALPDAEPGQDVPLRCVLDFRTINRNAMPQKYSMKDCRECLDDIGRAGAKLYSQLDLTSGFWQMSLAKESRPYTAFTVPGKMGAKFEWCVMPMGLQGSSSSFAMLVDFVLRGVKGISSYIDDVLTFSDTHENQLVVLEEVFLRFRKYGLKINMEKSVFATTECQYLGFTLKNGTITTSKDKAAAIKSFPLPRSPKAIREFLGICNYFRGIIRNYHQKAEPLMKVLRPSTGWKGGELPPAAITSFQNLKEILSSEPVLTLPRKDRQYILYTDGAQGDATDDGGMGAMLVQEDPEGEEYAIGYASRALKKNEANYSAHLLEQATIVWAIDYFAHYLKGVRFIIRSDNKPSVELGTVHKKTLSRLQEAMLEFDFALEHVEGKNNKAADALSRNACVMALYAIDENEVSVEYAQRSCPTIGVLKRYLESGEIPEEEEMKKWVQRMAKTCNAEDGLVWHAETRRGHRKKQLLLVPEGMRNQLIAESHARPEAGHGGVDRTAERIQMAFWWPNIRNDCHEFVKGCETCQLARTTKPAPAHLVPLQITTRPGERVHLDLFGPVLTSSGGNKFILVITDSFSKWTICVPIPNKSAEEVGKAYFERWLCMYGASEALVSDCGREFCNSVVNEICQLWGCDKRNTTPWHPQTNSLAERYNQSIINYMRCALDNDSTLDWETRLPMLQLSFNAHVHRATMETPFFMMFGRDPRLPYTNFRKNRWYGQSYAAAQMQAMHSAYSKAKENMREAEIIRKNYYSRKSKERQFHIGDRVLVHFPHTPKGVNRKFYKYWKMCRVVAKVGPVNLRVRTMKEEPRKKSEFLIHVDRCQHASQSQIEEFCDSVKAEPKEKQNVKRGLRSLEKEEDEIKRKRRLQYLKEIEEAESEGFMVEIVKRSWQEEEPAGVDRNETPTEDHDEIMRHMDDDHDDDHEERRQDSMINQQLQEFDIPVNEEEESAKTAEEDDQGGSRDVFRPRKSAECLHESEDKVTCEGEEFDSVSSGGTPEARCLPTPRAWCPNFTTQTQKTQAEEKDLARRDPVKRNPKHQSTSTSSTRLRRSPNPSLRSQEKPEGASIGGRTATKKKNLPRGHGKSKFQNTDKDFSKERGDAAEPQYSSPTGAKSGDAARENSGCRPSPESRALSSSEDQSSMEKTEKPLTRSRAKEIATSQSPSHPISTTGSSRNTVYIPPIPLERMNPLRAERERQKILRAMQEGRR